MRFHHLYPSVSHVFHHFVGTGVSFFEHARALLHVCFGHCVGRLQEAPWPTQGALDVSVPGVSDYSEEWSNDQSVPWAENSKRHPDNPPYTLCIHAYTISGLKADYQKFQCVKCWCCIPSQPEIIWKKHILDIYVLHLGLLGRQHVVSMVQQSPPIPGRRFQHVGTPTVQQSPNTTEDCVFVSLRIHQRSRHSTWPANHAWTLGRGEISGRGLDREKWWFGLVLVGWVTNSLGVGKILKGLKLAFSTMRINKVMRNYESTFCDLFFFEIFWTQSPTI